MSRDIYGGKRVKNLVTGSSGGKQLRSEKTPSDLPLGVTTLQGRVANKKNQKKKKPALNAASGAPADSLRHGVVCSLASFRFVCRRQREREDAREVQPGKGRLSPKDP